MEGERTLPFPGGEASHLEEAEDLPLIYIASPLTRADALSERRRNVTFQVDKIVATIQDPRFDGTPAQYRTHAPAVMSAPWASNASEWDIYRQNTHLVLAEADALIVLALQGGSSGTGQELELACRRGIPILHLAPTDEPVSRQVTGNPLVHVESYELPEQLASAVRQFIQSNRTKIERGPRYRRNTAILYRPLQADLWNTWRRLGNRDQDIVAEQCQLASDYIDHYLGHPLLTATLSLNQLIQIGDSLDIDVVSYFAQPSSALTYRQLRALVSAEEESGWTEGYAAELLQHAEQVQAMEGVRRLMLSSPADWHRLSESM